MFNKRLAGFESIAHPDTSKEDLLGNVYRALYRWLFKLEEKPIVTRFWLFSMCVWTLLRFLLLGIDLSEVLVTQTKKPNKDNKKRLTAVLKYFADEHQQKMLRTASLCLRLTSYATNLTGQTKEGAHELPLFVRLSQGTVQRKSSALLQRILSMILVDDKVDVTSAVLGLFTTEGHIIMRFEQYLHYPYKLWRLTKEFNPAGYAACILEFLDTDDQLLDVGYSLQLKREALATGSLADAVSFLMTSEIQEELSGICWKSACNSLDAERKIGQEKKSETMQASGLPRASRNGILLRYRLQRDSAVQMCISDRKQANKDKFMNSRALAIKKNPNLVSRPRGRLTGRPEDNSITAEQMKENVHEGDEKALQEYIEANRASLEAEAAAIRKAASFKLGGGAKSLMPMTNVEWLKWLEEHDEKFRWQLKNATIQRRPLGKRLAPDGDLPAASRIQAQHNNGPLPMWCIVLAQQDSGCYCLEIHGNGRQQRTIFFASALHRRPWIVTLQPHASMTVSFDTGRNFFDHFRPAHEVINTLGVQEADEAWDLFKLDIAFDAMTVATGEHGSSELLFAIKQATKLDKAPKKRSKDEEEAEDAASAMCSDSDACSLCSLDSAAEG